MSDPTPAWPRLPADEWQDTRATLHRWLQVVGKIRMARSPWLNHSWGVTLYVTPRGLTTSLIPDGDEAFELRFDFLAHELILETSTGRHAAIPLHDRSVADFHAAVMAALRDAGMPVSIDPMPSEIADAVPFPDDEANRTYVPEHAHALWRALLASHRVMSDFRAGFRGKASPVHLFWGSFDLAVTRFSGRLAPPHPGGLPNFPLDVAQEAYSHEVTSVGLWLGDRESPAPIYYAYAYPSPEGYAEASVEPAAAQWLEALGEFVLPYEAVRTAADPDATLLAFFESTHAAAAELAGWDREALECRAPMGPEWWRQRGASRPAV
jgi:hypothetical protein